MCIIFIFYYIPASLKSIIYFIFSYSSSKTIAHLTNSLQKASDLYTKEIELVGNIWQIVIIYYQLYLKILYKNNRIVKNRINLLIILKFILI